MAGITLAQAEAKLAAYLDAETKVLAKQRYRISDRELQKAPLESIQAGVKIWNDRVQNLSARATGRGRARTIIVG